MWRQEPENYTKMESVIEEQVEPMDTSELLYSSAQDDVPTSQSLETCFEVPNQNTVQPIPMDAAAIEPIVIDLETDQPYDQEHPTIITTATSVVTDIATAATNIDMTTTPVITAETQTKATTETPVVATTTNLILTTNTTPILTTITVPNSATKNKNVAVTTAKSTRETSTVPTEKEIPIEATVQISSLTASTTTAIEIGAVTTMASETSATILVTPSAVNSNQTNSNALLPVETQDIILVEPPTSPNKETSELAVEKTQTVERLIFKDSGIFDFMTPDRAIELYKIIALNGPPDLEWKCYGKRKPKEQEEQPDINESNASKDGEVENPQEPVATGFDFDDEDFGDLETSLPNVSESLRLKKRDSGIERRTNLSDIMSDIMKESHTEGEL